MVDDPYEDPFIEPCPCPQCEKVRQLKGRQEPTWTWPATVAFVAVLAFLAFVIWMIFG